MAKKKKDKDGITSEGGSAFIKGRRETEGLYHYTGFRDEWHGTDMQRKPAPRIAEVDSHETQKEFDKHNKIWLAREGGGGNKSGTRSDTEDG